MVNYMADSLLPSFWTVQVSFMIQVKNYLLTHSSSFPSTPPASLPITSPSTSPLMNLKDME